MMAIIYLCLFSIQRVSYHDDAAAATDDDGEGRERECVCVRMCVRASARLSP